MLKTISLLSMCLTLNLYCAESNVFLTQYSNRMALLKLDTEVKRIIHKTILLMDSLSSLDTGMDLMKNCLNPVKYHHFLLKTLIQSANAEIKINKQENYLFNLLFNVIQSTKDKKGSLAEYITCHNDLETIFRGMLSQKFIFDDFNLFKRDPNNTDSNYQDNLIRDCIKSYKDKYNEKTGNMFFKAMTLEINSLRLYKATIEQKL